MSYSTEFRVHRSDEEGILAVQAPDFYAMFQSYPGAGNLGNGDGAVYGYGIMKSEPIDPAARGWVVTRTDDSGRLVPHDHTKIDVQLRGNTLVVPEDRVESVLGRFAEPDEPEDWPPSTLPVEILFRRSVGRMVGDSVIEGCATYNLDKEHPRIAYINKLGGYIVGVDAAVEERAAQLKPVAIELKSQ